MPAVWSAPPRSTPPPLGLVAPGGWRDEAACADHPTLLPRTWDDDSELDRRAGQREKRIAAAVAVCRTCPVQDPCLAAVDLNYDRGVRGGVDIRRLLEARNARAGRRE